MRLNDPLADTIYFENQEYPIDLSFNRVLDCFEVFERTDILTKQKLIIVNKLLIGKNDLSFNKQVDLWNFVKNNYISTSGKRSVSYDLEGNPMPILEERNKKVIDLVQDAKYIYASFKFCGIDLFEQQNKLHWEEFQALLESLPEDTIMQRIVQIRLWKPQKGESAKYKEQMKKAQARYRLEGFDDEEEGDDYS